MSSKLDLSKDLVGRRALVTGGTRGMGAVIAQRLIDAGAKVAVTGRSRGDAIPAGAIFIAGDVSSAEGVKTIAAEAIAALGGLDVLVNSAGGARPFAEGTTSIPDEEWQASFEINLFAAVRLTNAVLPALSASKAGAIVNISSNASKMAFGPFAHYCAAKAALDMYSRTLALDLGPKGIRVNVVSPGPVETPGGDGARKAFSDATGAPPDVFAQSVPLGRLGSPGDVAEIVALLASDRSSWMTGANILVDGGMTAR